MWFRRMGGFASAELLVYERELSEREKVATSNYLNAKWYKNGTKVTPTSASVHLSGGWDQVSMIVADESALANASGFVFD
ncbi:MAG: hypothetical protein IJC66_07520 [Kiritimatiellae bacterium]|nr:hypothetical protein [Kiritimatiellia bacterium]